MPYARRLPSNTLTKTVVSQWSKTLTVLPKGNLSSPEPDINVVVAHGQNINGEPFSGELVCIVATGESVTWMGPGLVTSVGGFDLTGSTTYTGNRLTPTNSACGWTGTAGNVAFDVSGSNSPTNVDVKGVWESEHLMIRESTSRRSARPLRSPQRSLRRCFRPTRSS